MSDVIQVTGLTRTYAGDKGQPPLTAVAGIDFTVREGEVFEAQALSNFVRFPMMFLGGVFVPLASLPFGLQVVARLLPLTYAVEALRAALFGGASAQAALDLLALASFAAGLFVLAVRVLARRVE